MRPIHQISRIIRTWILSIGFILFSLISTGQTDTTIVASDTVSVSDIVEAKTDSVVIQSPDVGIPENQKGEEPSKSFLENITGAKVFYAIVILLLTYIFLRIISKVLNVWGELSTKRRVTLKGIIPVLRIVVWTSSITFIIVSVIRPPMASLLAFGASVGVAVGFASQDLLKNIFGGITIIFDRPFKVGDKVSIGEFYGEIVQIGLRSTRLVTPDDNLVSVPNAELMNKSVSNANAGEDNCQVVTDLYLPVQFDTQKARKLAYEAAAVSPYIYINKPIVVLFEQETIGHQVVLRMRVKAYVNDTRKENAFKSDITEILTKELYIKENINPVRTNF